MGRAIAQLFAAEGAALALLDVNEDGVRQVGDELAMAAYRCNVADREEVNAVVAAAAQALGGLDGVVNAAGTLDITPFADLEPESWDVITSYSIHYTKLYDV